VQHWTANRNVILDAIQTNSNSFLPSSTPILSTARRSIHNKLGCSTGMHRSHESLGNTVLLMNDLGHGSKTVGGTTGVRNDIGGSIVVCVVDTDDVHGCIGGGSGDDHLLGSTSEMGLLICMMCCRYNKK
jgi:hypothetical protein